MHTLFFKYNIYYLYLPKLVPRTLRPIASGLVKDSSEFKDEMEDYISPSNSITYTLHPQYIINAEKLTITVSILATIYYMHPEYFSLF